jgi:hypothetical protein
MPLDKLPSAPHLQSIKKVDPQQAAPKQNPKRRSIMNVVDYCKGMEMELIAWKAKMFDLTRKVESLGSKEREKVLPNIQDLNILIVEMSSRIDQLKNECPTEWTPQKKDIDSGSVDMRGKYEQTMEYIGKHSPVSIAG